MTNPVNSIVNSKSFVFKTRPEARKTGTDTSFYEKMLPKAQSLNAPEILPEDKAIIKERLNNPDLEIMDRLLMFSYLRSRQPAGNAGDAGTKKDLIRKRFIVLGSECLARYSGREDTGKLTRRYDAFTYLVEALSIFSNKEMLEIVLEINKPHVPPEDQKLIDNYRNNPDSMRSYGKIIEKINRYYNDWHESIWGTKERADLYRKRNAFTIVAAAYGVPEDNGNAGEMDENHVLTQADPIIYTPEKIDDEKIRPKLLGYYEKSAEEFFSGLRQSEPTLNKLLALGEKYRYCRDLADKLGVPVDELDVIDESIKSRTCNKSVTSKGSTKVLPPCELPKGVIDLLKGTEYESGRSYYDHLVENVEYIILSSEKQGERAENALNIGTNDGLWVADGVVYINTAGIDRLAMPADHVLFDIILHECSHSGYYKEYFGKDPDKLRTIPNEKAAYSFEAHALRRLERSFTAPQSVKDGIDTYISSAEAMVRHTSALMSSATEKTDIDIDPVRTPFHMAYNVASFLSQYGYINAGDIGLYEKIFSALILDEIELDKIPPALAAGFDGLHLFTPDKAKNLFFSWLCRIDSSWQGITYEISLENFKDQVQKAMPKKKMNGQAILSAFMAYSFDYKVESTKRITIDIYDGEKHKMDALPNGAIVRLCVASPETWAGRDYVKIKYGHIEGYISYDNFAEDLQYSRQATRKNP